MAGAASRHKVHVEPVTDVILMDADGAVRAQYDDSHIPMLNCTFDGANPGAVRYRCDGIALFWYPERQWNFGETWEGIVPADGRIAATSPDGSILEAQLAPDVGGDFRFTLTRLDGRWQSSGDQLQIDLDRPATAFLDRR